MFNHTYYRWLIVKENCIGKNNLVTIFLKRNSYKGKQIFYGGHLSSLFLSVIGITYKIEMRKCIRCAYQIWLWSEIDLCVYGLKRELKSIGKLKKKPFFIRKKEDKYTKWFLITKSNSVKKLNIFLQLHLFLRKKYKEWQRFESWKWAKSEEQSITDANSKLLLKKKNSKALGWH